MSGFRRRAPLTGAGLSSTLARWTQPGFIKSIQRGTVTITTATSATATITSVDVANSVIRFLGNQTDNTTTDATVRDCRVTLTNATTVTGFSGSASQSYIVSFEVTEYFPGVLKSVQRGTVLSGTPATITRVNTLKAELSYLGQTNVGNNNDDINQNSIVLTNATTVTATENNSTGGATVGFQVAEYY